MIRASTLLAGSLVALVAAVSWANVVRDRARELEQAPPMDESNPLRHKRPIFYSELKLRAVIESTNDELRQLKRDFMLEMTNVYLALKLDPVLGFERAREQGARTATANVLLAEEFATMAIKKHIIQRRLLTGLKLAFTKLLPMQTLVNLYRRYKSFEWLKDQEQVDLRPRFPGVRESDFVVLYSLIELRARVRAANDLLALTANNQRRVLQVVQWYLVESNHGPEVSGIELSALALNSKTVMQFFDRDVLEKRDRLHAQYQAFLSNSRPLAEIIGGAQELTHFIDRLIDVEALDIDLNAEAQSFAFPPTINEEMILNVQKRWIPLYVLKSLEEDRKVLIDNRKRVMMQFVRLDPRFSRIDVREWNGNLLDYVCHNQVHEYAR